MDSSCVLRLCDDVRHRFVADQAVVVRLDSAEVLVLNEVGNLTLQSFSRKDLSSEEAERAAAGGE